jgi:hypothetical protein
VSADLERIKRATLEELNQMTSEELLTVLALGELEG